MQHTDDDKPAPDLAARYETTIYVGVHNQIAIQQENFLTQRDETVYFSASDVDFLVVRLQELAQAIRNGEYGEPKR